MTQPLTAHQVGMLEVMAGFGDDLLARAVATIRDRERQMANQTLTCGAGHEHVAALWICPDREHKETK